MRSKNRIRKLYKGYDKALKPFKREMIELMESNKALAVAICETYRAGQYSSQYWRTIGYFGRNHKAAYIDFCKTGLSGKVLCGRDEFWLTLRSCGYSDIYEKYKNAIPEKKAFGIIFGNALRIINKR
ncbi:MAG: hypothetical protein E7D79_14520 [Clostridium perfringens]|uniref:hypothetical protein n=1 Tax=Clostridium perfringens TaxID=1502 RepID=UPI0002496441|nr:hypothetical protein [Clostridium perfringens]EHP45084.1 hypothetical protein HMPREF9476_03151 [Clostridium perfringens WAL-14572]MDU2320369.1 hypothetical protein [Clostridium perfringens]